MCLMRQVYLSDRLLELLSDDQVEAVLMHEAGHLRRHHLLTRFTALAAPLALLWAAARTHPALLARRVWAKAVRVAVRVAPVAIQPKNQSFPAN